MVMGRSGSGKTYSLKNFQKDEVGTIAVEKSRLPFRSDLKMIRIPSFDQDPELNSNARINAARYAWIQNVIQKARVKSIVIDDSQFLLVNEFFDRSEERGYNKYTDIARNFRVLIHFVNELPDGEGHITAFANGLVIRYLKRVDISEDEIVVHFKAGIEEHIKRASATSLRM